MAKLTNLQLEEFSIVRGSEYEPANPAAKALIYKATNVQKENAMPEELKPPPEETKKSLGTQIAEALAKLLGGKVEKAQQTRTSSYNSQSTEVWDDGQPAADAGTTTIVITDGAVANAKQVAKTAPPSNPGTEQTFRVNLADAVAAGVEPLVKAVETMDGRLTAIEKASSGSRQVRQAIGNPAPAGGGEEFGEFTKFLKEQSGLTPGQRLTKATITSGGWSYGLSVHEAEKFIDYIIGEETLLKKIRHVVMPDKTFNLDKIGLGSKVLVKATPGTDPGDTVSISGPTQVQLNAQEIIAIVSIGDDTLEDNIEGDAFVQKLLGMIGRAAANEIEQAAIHGDTAVADTGILDRWDGFYKLAKANGAHVTEAMADTDRYWPGTNGGKAARLIKSIPTKYRQDFRQMGVLLHNDLYIDYQEELASKGYSEAYMAITGMQNVPIRSIANITVPMMKTDMAFTYSATPYTDGAFVMITDLRNLILGIHRDIRIEPYRQPRKRATDYVLTMRGDVKIENGDAIAIYDHAKVRA